MAGVAATFFLDHLAADPVEFRLLNKLQHPIYVLSDVVDLNQSTHNEIVFEGDLYQELQPGKQLVLIKDYTVVNPKYITEYKFSSPDNSVPILTEDQPRELFMTDISRYKVSSSGTKKIFVREIYAGDVSPGSASSLNSSR